jgi:hypothetical protein
MSNKFEIGDGGFKLVKNENIHIFENKSNGIVLFMGNITPVIKDRWLAARVWVRRDRGPPLQKDKLALTPYLH